MFKKKKVLGDKKLMAVKEYLDGNGSLTTVGIKYGVSESSFRKWVAKYKAFGDCAFVKNKNRDYYTREFKMNVVNEYLNGKGALYDLAIKYKMPSHTTLSRWILKYNSHEEFKTSRTGGKPILTNRRRTNYDERIEIVQYCIEHENNYAITAEQYQVSYQQVYAWMKKYEQKGVEGLLDRRGLRKPEDEMSELEKLRAENRLLKTQNKRQEMEMEFLKKLDEIERRRF
ncbi:MAG: helix-turn-helix domain-containing protein [Eubacteriaceae bacterium]